MKVLIDTNAFAIPYQFKIDIIEEIKRLVPGAQLATLESVVKELKNLEDKRASKMAMDLIEINKIEIIDESGYADAALLAYAQSNDAIVFTNDRELKKSCQKMGVPVMYMRKKKHLEIEGL